MGRRGPQATAGSGKMAWMTLEGKFAAVITCMDGRIQTRTLDQVMTRCGARYVDNITSTGAVQHLDGSITPTGEGLLHSLGVSVGAHGTTQVAIVAHSGCAGNPVPDNVQKQQLHRAVEAVSTRFPDLEVLALFFDPAVGFERIR